MASITKLEYRVRKVERYIITRYEEREEEPGCAQAGSSSVRGEFSDANTAYEVAYALCKVEHEAHLGWPIDDERVQYPRHPHEPNYSSDMDHRTAQAIAANVPAGDSRAAL